jgi:hypothetical protein
MKLAFSPALERVIMGRIYSHRKSGRLFGHRIHGLIGTPWTEDGAPFSRANTGKTVRSLFDEGFA